MSKNDPPPDLTHQRRESELSAPVSDYEYFQFSPAVARPPPSPSTSAAPPYVGAPQTPISPHMRHGSYTEHQSSLPEVVPEGKFDTF